MVDVLKMSGHQVTGCDIGWFAGCEWEPLVCPDSELIKDVADITLDELDGHDAICHLAAISNDPMGELDPEVTLRCNRDNSVELARKAKAVGIGRFLFSGSCSVYGAGAKEFLEEDDPLHPLTAYARSKIETEYLVSELADDDFSPVFLRNATAFGHSPMLRIDLVANNLLGSAFAYGEIRIKSDGTPWRPLIHCRDIARAFEAFLVAPRSAIHNQAVNVGGNDENYQVRDVGDAVQRLVPQADITYSAQSTEDPRNYRVCFDKLNRLLPDFRLQYSLERGLRELYRKMVENDFNKADFEGDRFVRLRTLRNRIGATELSATG